MKCCFHSTNSVTENFKLKRTTLNKGWGRWVYDSYWVIDPDRSPKLRGNIWNMPYCVYYILNFNCGLYFFLQHTLNGQLRSTPTPYLRFMKCTPSPENNVNLMIFWSKRCRYDSGDLFCFDFLTKICSSLGRRFE